MFLPAGNFCDVEMDMKEETRKGDIEDGNPESLVFLLGRLLPLRDPGPSHSSLFIVKLVITIFGFHPS